MSEKRDLKNRVFTLVNRIYEKALEDLYDFERVLDEAMERGQPLEDLIYRKMRMSYEGSRVFFQGGGLEDWLELLGLEIDARAKKNLWNIDETVDRVEEKHLEYRRRYVNGRARQQAAVY